jgi:hypothetical protein
MLKVGNLKSDWTIESQNDLRVMTGQITSANKDVGVANEKLIESWNF